MTGAKDVLSDEKVLRSQMRQMREIIDACENSRNSNLGMKENELKSMMEIKYGENEPLHPRILRVFNSHVDMKSLEKGLKRMENDLEDLNRTPEELRETPRNLIDEKNGESMSTEEDKTENIESDETTEQRELDSFLDKE